VRAFEMRDENSLDGALTILPASVSHSSEQKIPLLEELMGFGPIGVLALTSWMAGKTAAPVPLICTVALVPPNAPMPVCRICCRT
jgi:hypothetical protein